MAFHYIKFAQDRLGRNEANIRDSISSWLCFTNLDHWSDSVAAIGAGPVSV